MRTLLLLLLSGFLYVGGYAQVFNGSLAGTDSEFNRPDPGTPPTTFSTVGTAVRYDVIAIVITTPGIFSFTSSSPWDNFGVLYGPGGFNPADPLSNALVANDDLSGTNFGFTFNFTVAGTYYLVITSFKNGAEGPYAVTMTPASVIPLRLMSFTAEKTSNSTVMVNWIAAQENNIDRYQLQRSTDGKNFYDLSNNAVLAKNSSLNAAYNITDNSPASGLNFYRLKITEKGGRVTLSTIAAVSNKKSGLAIIKVFPNPTSDYLYVETKSGQRGKAYLSVVNASGERVSTKEYVLNNQGILSVDVRRLSAGKYFLKTNINNEESVVSFIKN